MKVIFSVGLLMILNTTFAQWHIGGRTGVTFSNYKTKTTYTEIANRGFAMGVAIYNQMSKHGGVSLGFDYVEKGYQHHLCSSISDRLETTYLEVPVMFDYAMSVSRSFKVHARVGGYLGYWVAARDKAEGFDGASGEFDFDKSKARRIDYGSAVGALLEYTLSNSRIGFEIKYEQGLRDMQTSSGDNTRNVNSTWLMGLSYMLPFVR